MQRKVIHSDRVPPARVPLSQGIRMGDWIFASGQLGMSRSQLHQVVHGFCEDLLATSQGGWADACRIDAATLAGLMAEIASPDLQRTLLRLSLAIVDADHHLAEGESLLLAAAVAHWELQAALLKAPRQAAAEAMA